MFRRRPAPAGNAPVRNPVVAAPPPLHRSTMSPIAPGNQTRPPLVAVLNGVGLSTDSGIPIVSPDRIPDGR